MKRGKQTSLYLTEKELEMVEKLEKFGFGIKEIFRVGLYMLTMAIEKVFAVDLILEILEKDGWIELYKISRAIQEELKKKKPDYQKIGELYKKYETLKKKLIKKLEE